MVGSDFKAPWGHKQKDVVKNSCDFDVGFITGGCVVDGAFEFEVELVAVERGSLGVVENSLIRDVDVKDGAKNIGGFSGGDGEWDVERENKA